MNSLEMELRKGDEFKMRAYDLKMNYLLSMMALAKELKVIDQDCIREIKDQLSRVDVDFTVAAFMDFDFPSVITL